MSAAFGRGLRERWLLEPGTLHLNHGSFGATPRAVLAAQLLWRERMERNPTRFLGRELGGRLRDAAARLGDFLQVRGADLVWVDNATSAVNAVLRGWNWQSGDELLLGSHAYEAVRQAAHFIAADRGVVVREARVPFPLHESGAALQAYADALTPATRLAIVDHVTSPTALVMPVREIAALCRARGVAVLVDGAHAPGMLALDIARIGADWYAGNCHKWLFAPKGCAFLWTAPAHQAHTHPTVISKGYGVGYCAEFDWTGTRDPSPWLSIDAALDFHRELQREGLMQHNHELAASAAQTLASAWRVAPPAAPELLGAMATVALPECWQGAHGDVAALRRLLSEDYLIEVPVLELGALRWVRISAQAYNEAEDYVALARAVSELTPQACEGRA